MSASGNFKFIDLFAGIGGMRLGFESVGGTCVFSSEWDPFAQKTYSANFGDLPHGDITKIEASDIPKHDVLLGGFPCQPFSSIGMRQGFNHPTQGTLFYDVVRILEFHQPRAFLLENVAGLTTHDGGNTFRIIRESLIDLGYQIHYEILDAANYGVPQHRRRIYIVGLLGGKAGGHFRFPEPNSNLIPIGPFIETGVVGHSISKKLQTSYIFKFDDGKPQIVTPETDHPVKTLVASYHKIQRLTGTFVADGETGLRLLTVAECKSIQGFPKHFEVPVSRTQMYRQFGNSVSVPTIAAIAQQIQTELLKKSGAIAGDAMERERKLDQLLF